MASPSDPAPDEVPHLLAQGLAHYGRGESDKAVSCWLSVLRLDPEHAEAMDYLDAAGVKPPEPELDTGTHAQAEREPGVRATAKVIELGTFKQVGGGGGAVPANLDASTDPAADTGEHAARGGAAAPVLDRKRMERLLSEGRLEDVLKLLYAARARAPRDASLSRSIRHVRERLSNDYASRLMNLDLVPMPAERCSWAELADADWSDETPEVAQEARQLASLVDGISSYADIVAASHQGKLATLRGLCALLQRGHIRVPQASTCPPPANVPAPPVPSRGGAPSAPMHVDGPLPTREPRAVARSVSGPVATAPATTTAHGESAQPKRRSGSAPRPDIGPEDAAYVALFKQATEAYLLRDFDRAIALFDECCRRRPADRRPKHNLEALMRRVSRS